MTSLNANVCLYVCGCWKEAGVAVANGVLSVDITTDYPEYSDRCDSCLGHERLGVGGSLDSEFVFAINADYFKFDIWTERGLFFVGVVWIMDWDSAFLGVRGVHARHALSDVDIEWRRNT